MKEEMRHIRKDANRKRAKFLPFTFSRITFVGLLGALCLLCPEPIQAGGHYYKYRDKEGRLHISNTRRAKGDWKLWKSFGSGGKSAAKKPKRRSRVGLNSDRLHRYDSYIGAAARRYQIPEALIRAVVHTESNYYPHVVSRVGAMGLMQLMPGTAKQLGVRDAFDPEQNILGGSRYLRMLANRFNGDMVLVIAGYHAGAGNVRKYGGIPPFSTTRAYVKAVLRRYYAYERQSQLEKGARRRGPARNIAG